MIIRQVNIADLERLSYIENICFSQAEAASKESIKQRINAFPECFYVAEVDDQIVGFINGCITNEKELFDELYSDTSLHLQDGAYQTIFGLLVLPEYQRQGIAAALMNYFIDLSRTNNRQGMVLTCKEHLIPYYEKFSYVNHGVSKSQHGGVTWYDMRLTF